MLFHPFFKIKNSSTTKLHSPKFGVVDFKNLTPDAAFDLWDKGFEHLIINKEGVKTFLIDKSESEIIQLIQKSKSSDELKNIAAAVKSKKVKQVAKSRITYLLSC